jgi:hypothetical protein
VVADKGHIAALIGHLAGRQHGHVSRQQLLELGVPKRTITHRIAARDLVVVHAGVYALGHAGRSALARAQAAVLACGPEAALSHESALALWGLREWPFTPEVTAATRKARPGIHTHRSQILAGDVWTRFAVRVTHPVRTICDIAPRRSDRQLVRLINEARLNKHLTATNLSRLLLRCPRLGPLIDPQQHPTRSYLEDDFVTWIKQHHLPMPRINATLNGHEVDVLYEDQKLIIELDDWRYHQGRQAFNHDHARDAAHRAIGYDTIRYTGEQLTDAEAVNLRRRLDR